LVGVGVFALIVKPIKQAATDPDPAHKKWIEKTKPIDKRREVF
jgi:hypothetical protein